MDALKEPIRLSDFEVHHAVDVEDFFQTSRMGGRDRASLEAKLVADFKRINKHVLDLYEVDARFEDNDGRGRKICFSTQRFIGACPLRSPLSGKWDYRLVIQPRIGWSGLGGMLSTMGWKVIPELQPLPAMKQSAKEIPNWVISSVIVARIEGLLRDVSRKYIERHDYLRMPRGRIDWQEYITRQLPQLQWMEVPCEFSQLGNNPDLMGIINFILHKVLCGLGTVQEGGAVVADLVRRVHALLKQVGDYPSVRPTSRMFLPIFYGRSTSTNAFLAGLEAMQWSAEDRGLAGLSDLRGLAWRMSIADFFEAYIEVLTRRVAVYTGGIVTVGRQNETVIPVSWEESWSGTQKSLRPDVVLHKDDEVIIIDAKFKGYWKQISTRAWDSVDAEFQEEHRHDLLQVLSYSSCFSESRITVCLIYPCEDKQYSFLREHKKLHRKAHVRRGDRKINVVLTAVPMQARIDDIAADLAAAIRR